MIIKANGTTYRSEFMLWALFTFFMPIWQNILPLILGFILLIRVIFKSRIVNRVTRMDCAYLILFILLYAAHALGMLWTVNVAHGMFDLQVKLVLVLIPLLLFTSPLDKEDLMNAGFGGLIVGSIVAAIVGFLYVVRNFISADANTLYVGEGFSFYMHQGYFAAFFCISLIVLLELLIRRNRLFTGIALKVVWGCILLLSTAILFTLSRTGSIVFILSVFAFSVKALLKWRSKKILAFLVVGMLAGVVVVSTTAERLIGRFEGLIETLNVSDQLNVNATDANTIRILLWDVSTDLISENFWKGVGTGDIKDELKAAATNKGYKGLAQMELNAHNQFTQVFITLGFPAFLIFILLFLVPVVEALRRRSILILLATLTMVLFNLTESFVERQAGVMFFAWLFPVLVYHFRGYRKDPA